MKYDFFDKNWLDKHTNNLRILRADLELRKENFEIYTAIDYYDINDYCFDIPRLNDISYGIKFSKPIIKRRIRDQISRSILFFLLEDIYKKPNILLTPYMIEANDFIMILRRDMRDIISKETKFSLEKLSKEYIELIKEAELTGDFHRLINFMNDNSPGLIYYYSRGFTNGARMFFHLLKNCFTADFDYFAETKDIERLISPRYYMDAEESKEFRKLERSINQSRFGPPRIKKDLQNERDTEAVYLTSILNKLYNSSNKIFIFISSAKNIQKAMKKKRIFF